MNYSAYNRDVSKSYDYRGSRTMQLLRSLVEAHRSVIEADDAQIESYGLSSCEFDCLVTLGVAQPLRMCDLASQSLMTKSHTTQVMKALERRGLVRRERSPESDREVLASLTAEGETLFERIYPLHYHWLTALFGERLSDEEQQELTGLLRKLADGG